MATKPRPLNRREFLKLTGLTGMGIFLQGCRSKEPPSSSDRVLRTRQPTATSSPTAFQLQVAAASATPTPSPAPSATPLPPHLVATAKVQNYEAGALRATLERMVDSIGGFERFVGRQARVGIKVNLTGGTWWDAPDKPPANELFVTHPAVVGALCELLIDAGAGRLIVMDGLGDSTSFDAWGYTEMAAPIGVELLDLCKPDPYPGYDRFAVGPKGQVFSQFFLNQSLREIDVLISVAKMKCHSVTGVTLALKNLIGLAPISEYRQDPGHNHRSLFHGSSTTGYDTRLPRVIVDLNLACPVHFAIVDGIFTAEGGAGPWDPGLTQVKPGLLLAGRDPVAVDALATATMGFDPQAASGSQPFIHCDNYLTLASEAGLGTCALLDIPIAGPRVDEMFFPFRTAG